MKFFTNLFIKKPKAIEHAESVNKLPPFKSFHTKDPSEAVEVLFEGAIKSVPIVTAEVAETWYEDCKLAWSSEKLHSGKKRAIAALLKRNTRRMCSEKGFRDFKVHLVDRDPSAMIYAFFDDGSGASKFVPIAVWRTVDKYLACGNSDFR